MRIGLFPGSFKPYHSGHHAVVLRASAENDFVHVIASGADRIRPGEFPVKGAAMISAWSYIRAVWPGNCNLILAQSPVKMTYEILGAANLDNTCNDTFVVYADSNDMTANFPEKSRLKYFASLYNTGRVKFTKLERSETVQISGTMMRSFMASGQRDMFITGLPVGVDGPSIWRLLTQTS